MGMRDLGPEPIDQPYDALAGRDEEQYHDPRRDQPDGRR
jgi:hypothetical protein